jgi:serine/threonine-protein kinase
LSEGTEERLDTTVGGPSRDTTVAGGGQDSTLGVLRYSLGPDRRIGPYKLIRELGHGGMGTVFLAARADEQFEKRVALKILRGSDTEEVIRYFRRERQILAGLEHPNICRLLDGGSTEEGLPYFVMEYVEGEPIDRYCDERKLSIPERLKLFEGVCSAVQYAHRSLVVHRDLKPGNILVTEEGVPKLLDFGIAKLLNPGVAGGGAHETVMALTPDYASPEQVRGRAITTATDVYSLGVILFELLTGHRPYRVKSQEQVEVLKAVCEEEPDRPSTAVGRTEERRKPDGTTVTTTPEEAGRLRHETPERLKRRLKGDLDAIVLSALQKDPGQRYPSVEALSRDIHRYLDGLPITARRASTAYRLRKLAGRHKLGVAAAATILGLLVALAISMTLQASRVRKERDRATAEATKVKAMNLFLQEALGAADPWATGSKNVSLLDALRQAQSKATSTLEGQPLVEAAMLQTIGTTLGNLAEFTEAEKALRTAHELSASAAGPRSAEAGESLVRLTALYADWHKLEEAERNGREALAIVREVYGPRSLEAAAAMYPLGTALQRKADLKALKPLAEEMLAIARAPSSPTAKPESGVDRAKIETDALSLLAAAALEQEDYKTMESLDRERLAKLRAQHPGQHPDFGQALNDLATAQMMNGDLAGAEATYKEALAIGIAFFGEDYPEVASTRENLGNVYFRSGRYEETVKILQVVSATRRKMLGNDSEAAARTEANMATVLKKAGKLEESNQAYRTALSVLAAKLGPESLDVASVRSSLADNLRLQGKLEEADPLLREALEVRARVLGETHPATQRTLKALADLSTARGRPDEAAAYTKRLVPAK